MTKEEKLKKLANAIKDYKGSKNWSPNSPFPFDETPWNRAPQPLAIGRVLNGLARLKVKNVEEAVNRIEKFTSIEELHNFLRSL